MTNYNVSTGTAEVRVGADIALDSQRPADAPVLFTMQAAQLAADAYVVLDGVPQGDATQGLEIFSSVGLVSNPVVVPPPPPPSFPTNANARFVANGANFNGSVWQSNSAASITMQGTGVTLEGGFHYPNIHKKRISNPAISFTGKGYGVLATGSSATACTLAVVLVPHWGPHATYDIFHSNSGANPLIIKYSLARVQVYSGSAWVMNYETKVLHGGVLMFMVSIDAASSVGRIVFVDEAKSSKSFHCGNININGFNGYIGCADPSLTQLFAYMDVLDVNYYDHAMDYPEMMSIVHGLGVAYQVP